MRTIKAFECEGNLSLDREYLQSLSGGKFNVKEVYATMNHSTADELERVNGNEFDNELYDKYLEECEYNKADTYFENNAKCLSIEAHDIKTFTFKNEEVKEFFDQESGTLKGYSSIGGYTVLFLDVYNNVYCNTCATDEIESIVKPFTHWEGDSLYCEGCNQELPSEYGNPEEEDNNNE